MFSIIFLSAISFYFIEKLLNFLGPPHSLISHAKLKDGKSPKTPQNMDIVVGKKFWCWKNALLSFLHSTVTGIWATYCLYEEPKIVDDLFTTHTPDSLWLVSLSIGYFIHDIYHMLSGDQSRQSYELVLHHIIVICCFGLSLFSGQYIGYAVVALIVELNSIFLHLRQLLQLLGFNYHYGLYRLNSVINMGTFIVFRIATLSWMTRWLLVHREEIPLGFFSIGSAGLAIMTVMNIILFYRLLLSDFIKRQGASLNVVDSHLSAAKLATPAAPTTLLE